MRFLSKVVFIFYLIVSFSQLSIVFANYNAEKLFSLANEYRINNQFDSAMHFAIQSLRINEENNDSLAIFKSLHQIGMINVLNENYDAAEENFILASSIAIALNDTMSLAINYHHIGLVHQKKLEFTKVIPNYEKAKGFYLSEGDYLNAAVMNGNIGSTLMDQGDFIEGLPYLLKALSLKESHHATVGSTCHTLLDLSELYRGLGDYDQSIFYAERVITLSREAGEDRSLQLGYLFKARASHEKGDDEMAYQFLIKHKELKDSLFNEAKAKQIQELQISYESEKKDSEIASLEQAKELERSRKQLFLILGIAIFLIAAGVYTIQRQRVKRNKLLLEKEKELDRLKTNFFANISHEFRTPLTLILGPIQMKLSKEKDPVIRKELEMMERNAIRLQRLINDILDIAKSEEGKLDLKEESVNLSDSINGLVSSFQSLAESKNISYKVSVSDKPILDSVMIDKDKLDTILINLLSNAFKFTGKDGSIQFTASCVVLEGNKGMLTCIVKDSGLGIPNEKLKRIFDRFYQVDDSSTRKQQGTGIGLAFTKELTTIMGGEISANSVVDEGTSFKVELPFDILVEQKHSVESDIASPKSLHLKEALLSVDDNNEETEVDNDLPILLLVEDNSDLTLYIESLLSDDYQILKAENGEIGLNLALKEIPDLIISDIMMPVMDGYELCKSIKTNIATSHIPVLLLSAKSSTESRIMGLETEADVYMSKPFNPLELQLQVRNIFKQHQKVKDKYNGSESLMPEESTSNSVEQQFIQKLSDLMKENYRDPDYSVELLSSDIGLSRSQLHRKLSALTNESASKFIRSYRLKKSMLLLQAKSGNISEIAYDVGFNSASYFNKCFLEQFGKRPGDV